MTVATTREWLRGAVVAVPTPFHDDFSMDLGSLRTNIEAMIERGVRTGDGVLLVAGAGGEFPTLTRDERVAVMHASVEAAGGRAPTVTSIQHTDMREVIELAKAAEDAGIDGLQVGVPYYYPASADDLFRVVEAAGKASSLPLMIYSTWWEGGLDIDGALLLRLAELPARRSRQMVGPDPRPLHRGDRGGRRQARRHRQPGVACLGTRPRRERFRDAPQQLLAGVPARDLAGARCARLRGRAGDPRALQVGLERLGRSGRLDQRRRRPVHQGCHGAGGLHRGTASSAGCPADAGPHGRAQRALRPGGRPACRRSGDGLGSLRATARRSWSRTGPCRPPRSQGRWPKIPASRVRSRAPMRVLLGRRPSPRTPIPPV